MQKNHDNKDFEDLYKVYTESSCSYDKKPEDEEEEKDEDIVKEEEELEEDEEETVEEGIIDRTKARLGGLKDGIKGGVEGFRKGKGGGFDKKYESGKRSRILRTHMDKIDNVLSSLATDAVKMGLMEDSEAEQLASQISSQVKKSFMRENYGKGF